MDISQDSFLLKRPELGREFSFQMMITNRMVEFDDRDGQDLATPI